MLPKFISASQAHLINKYRTIKGTLLKCNSNIYFNKQCINKSVVPKYAYIKISESSPTARLTKSKAQKLRIRDELRTLYMKKQKLNENLYNIHLEVAKTWSNIWHIVEKGINEKSEIEMQKKYNALDKKL
jgi:urate oxidase